MMVCRKKITCLILTAILLGVKVYSQGWVVPDEQKEVVAPFKFIADSVKKGEAIFLKTCQSCHGLPGKHNWAKITPDPGDPATDKFQKQKDGELFFKITTGKAPMPEFRNILAENDRWNVIAYLRSFNPSYVQPAPVTKAGMQGRMIKLSFAYHKEINKLGVLAIETGKDKTKMPVKGADIVLYVKRYFGNMQVGEIKPTNDKGEALFDAPVNIPGDKTGNLELTAMIDDPKGLIGDFRVITTMAIGKPTNIPGLTETRAWWSTRDKAPIWVILTYSLAVIIAWGFIFYILFIVLRVRKI